MSHEKIFTREEAEELIPQLEPIVTSLIENKQNAMQIGQQLASLQEQVKESAGAGVPAEDLLNKQTELEFIVRIINENLEAIEATGAQPKDMDLGLVDFPAVLNGEIVLLCWKHGEKRIRYYHGMTDGFAGRKLLPGAEEH